MLATAALVSATSLGASLASAPATGASTDPNAAIGAAGPELVSPPGASASPELADGRLLVALDPGTSPDQAAALADSVDATDSALVGSTTLAVDVPPGDKAAATATLNADDRVQYVQPNYAVHAFNTPNDPLLAQQFGVGDAVVGGISTPTAWNTTFGSSSIVIGVLDSGLDLSHPDLAANLWTNRTGIKGCGYGTHGYNAIAGSCNPNDDDGHGTHVGGIAAARGNNGVGGTGVDRQGSLMALKMLDSNGVGGTATAVAAIDWAVAAKTAGVDLRVLVASWGGPQNNQLLKDAIARAGANGILFVTAAGNDGVNVDSAPEYPCSYTLANIICVGASNPSGALARTTGDPNTTDEFNSNYGVTSVDLVAPGVQILSTVPPGVVPGCGSVAYCYFWGTSMATPFVAGAAALVLSARPDFTVAQVKQQLLLAVDPIASLAGKVLTGGRLDVCKAMPGCGAVAPVVPTPPRDVNVLAGGGQATITWGAPDSNGNAAGVTGYQVTTPAGTTPVPPTPMSMTVTGLVDNTNVAVSVTAVNAVGPSAATPAVGRPRSGGYDVDGYGGVHPLRVAPGPNPSRITGGPYWSGWDIARGVAILPNGTGGYVLDGWGGLHPFSIGGNPAPPAATGGPYWPGWDIARDVVILPNGTGGFVLDGYGGLHPFGIGNQARAAPARSGPGWAGWDIARGVTVTGDSSGGYVLDGLGGIHPFSVGNHPKPVGAVGGPTFPVPIARGISLVPGSGGGWVLDGYGAIHGFRTTGPAPAAPNGGPLWPGWDIARGIRA